MSNRILLVEDDERIRASTRLALEDEGYEVQEAASGEAALDRFSEHAADLVLLDLMLPGIDGFECCRLLRRTSAVPVIMVTARTDTHDVIAGLEAGADDYVTKPFSPRELLARVRTAMRRSTRTPLTETFKFGDVKVDFTKMELWRDGKPVPLTSQEFKVLKFMIQNAERVLSREELLNQVWGYRNYPSTRTVDNHILRLRQKLEKDSANPLHFRTVHSSGYKFVP